MDTEDICLDACVMEMNECNIFPGTELELWETKDDRQHILSILEKAGFGQNDTIVAIGLAASAPSKRWPVEYYDKLVRMLSQTYQNMRFVLLGDVPEQGEAMAGNEGTLNLCGKVTLREIIALMRQVALYVGNDTGLMHIASACGCSVVEISSLGRDGNMSIGTSSNTRFSPWSRDVLIVQPVHQLDGCNGMCQMPYAHCIKQVTVEAVFEAVCKLLYNRNAKEI